MTNFFQLFIYSNGEVGLIKEHGSPEVQVASGQLTTVEPLVEHIKSLKPEDVPEGEFDKISLFKVGRAVYRFNDFKNRGQYKSYRTECSPILINDLVNEILSILPQE